jgi:hypothetical protein
MVIAYRADLQIGVQLWIHSSRVEKMMPTFGDVYIVSMIDHWCVKHLMEAVVVPLICTGLAAAKPWNLQA